MPRGRGADITLRLSVWAILLGGRSHSVEAFDGLGISRKNVYRILRELEEVPLLQVFESSPGFWRCSYEVKTQEPQYEFLHCGKCLKKKSVDDFYHQSNSATKREYYCKECKAKYNKKYRTQNKDRVNKAQRRRYKRNPKKYILRATEYYALNKDRINAQRRANHQLKKESNKNGLQPGTSNAQRTELVLARNR